MALRSTSPFGTAAKGPNGSLPFTERLDEGQTDIRPLSAVPESNVERSAIGGSPPCLRSLISS